MLARLIREKDKSSIINTHESFHVGVCVFLGVEGGKMVCIVYKILVRKFQSENLFQSKKILLHSESAMYGLKISHLRYCISLQETYCKDSNKPPGNY